MRTAKRMIKAGEWIDPGCPGLPSLKIEGNIIFSDSKVNIFGKQKLKQKKSYTFTLTMITVTCSIGVGVVDARKITEKELINNQNCICYCNDSLYWDGQRGSWRGDGFQVGDSVGISIDALKGEISWTVDGEVRHQGQNARLRDRSIQWVPYFWLCKGSSVMLTK